MIELMLTATGAQRLRFAISPLEEVLGAIQVLEGVRHHPAYGPWLSTTAEHARSLPIGELRTVLSATRYITEFLSPPPQGPRTTVEAQLAELRRTPPEQVALELAMVDADLSALPEDPATARDLLGDQLELAWHELIEPLWPRLHEVLTADIDHRTRRLGEGGIELAVADLHSRVKLTGGVLTVDSTTRTRHALDERGLLLLPSVFAWPKVGVILVPPWQPALLYPARGVAQLWRPAQDPDPRLVAVLGRTRALLLQVLAEPSTTTALARRLGLAPGTVSGHLRALAGAGLLAATRHGRSVRYARTRLGGDLIGA
ncbi:DUF5937 family protein [Amycolatopsis albispora]|uniref:Transcriptional regulator n=1 Tax=Amycolatopsis albispora TaxID=1804986 RepID=A0A344LEK6_9PSEU|nr:DUF5937 family protein [Amycolatopsis albispora]AXB46480.1 transcriptional regulator [Amycolatopsis albispora]